MATAAAATATSATSTTRRATATLTATSTTFHFVFHAKKKNKQRTKTASCNDFYNHANASLTRYSPSNLPQEAVAEIPKHATCVLCLSIDHFRVLKTVQRIVYWSSDYQNCLFVCPPVRSSVRLSVRECVPMPRAWHQSCVGVPPLLPRNHSTLAALCWQFLVSVCCCVYWPVITFHATPYRGLAISVVDCLLL